MAAVGKIGLILVSLLAFSVSGQTSDPIQASGVQYDTYSNVDHHETITEPVTFESHYLDFEVANYHTVLFSKTQDDLLNPDLNEDFQNVVYSSGSDRYVCCDESGQSGWTLSMVYANSNLYFAEDYAGAFTFYLPSLNNGYDSWLDSWISLFDRLGFEDVTSPYLTINGKSYVFLYYHDQTIDLLLAPGVTLNERVFAFEGKTGSYAKTFYRFQIDWDSTPVTEIGQLRAGTVLNYSSSAETYAFQRSNFEFYLDASMDGKVLNAPFAVSSVTLGGAEYDSFLLRWDSYTGIAYRPGESWTAWNPYSDAPIVEPDRWTVCTSDGYTNLEDLVFHYSINQDYVDKEGVLHVSDDSVDVPVRASIEKSLTAPGGTSMSKEFKAVVFSGVSSELKASNAYGVIALDRISFYLKTSSESNSAHEWPTLGSNSSGYSGFCDSWNLCTIAYSGFDARSWSYDSRPTVKTYRSKFDVYRIRADAWTNWSTYVDWLSLAGMANTIVKAVNGAYNELQVYGFEFLFAETGETIPNIQSIDFTFDFDGKRYHQKYFDVTTSDFKRMYGQGYDACNNLLTDSESFPRACTRKLNDELRVYDYALVHRFTASNGKALENLEWLNITYETEAFSVETLYNDATEGLHVVDGSVYDKYGNLRLDVTYKVNDAVDSSGTSNPVIDYYDKDGNKILSTGEREYTDSADSWDNFWKNLKKSWDDTKAWVIRVLVVVLALILIPLLVKGIKFLVKVFKK